MRTLPFGRTIALIIIVVALFSIETVAQSVFRPGDTIGEMVLRNSFDPSAIRNGSVGQYCNVPNPTQPETITVPCTAAAVDLLAIQPGWYSPNQQLLDERWALLTWQVFIDNHQLDLPAFGTEDTDQKQSGDTVRNRAWKVWIAHPTPGPHAIRVVYNLSRDLTLEHGLSAKAGIYDVTYQLTVEERPAFWTPYVPLLIMVVVIGAAWLIWQRIRKRRQRGRERNSLIRWTQPFGARP